VCADNVGNVACDCLFFTKFRLQYELSLQSHALVTHRNDFLHEYSNFLQLSYCDYHSHFEFYKCDNFTVKKLYLFHLNCQFRETYVTLLNISVQFKPLGLSTLNSL